MNSNPDTCCRVRDVLGTYNYDCRNQNSIYTHAAAHAVMGTHIYTYSRTE